MNRALPLVLATCFVCQPLFGQTPPAGSTDPTPTKPEFDQLVASYEAQEDAIDTGLKPQLLAARDKYQADLDALAAKLDQGKRPDEAKQVRAEAARFAEHGLNAEPLKTAPPAVRPLWSTLVHATADLTQSVALKRSSIRAKFDQDLTGLERAYRAKNDADGLGLIRRARATVAVRARIEANAYTTTEVVSKNPNWWQDIPADGGYVVGFDVGKGGWYQFSVLGSMKPIFQTLHGLRDGKRRGNSGGERVLARDGYAVGGLLVRAGDVVNATNVVFMRINPDGLTLNPQDSYLSGWMGGEAYNLKPVELNPRGHLIIGVTGASGDIVDSLGLVYLK